jgi:hypothetical protein
MMLVTPFGFLEPMTGSEGSASTWQQPVGAVSENLRKNGGFRLALTK